jgi:hypothetical protein
MVRLDLRRRPGFPLLGERLESVGQRNGQIRSRTIEPGFSIVVEIDFAVGEVPLLIAGDGHASGCLAEVIERIAGASANLLKEKICAFGAHDLQERFFEPLPDGFPFLGKSWSVQRALLQLAGHGVVGIRKVAPLRRRGRESVKGILTRRGHRLRLLFCES